MVTMTKKKPTNQSLKDVLGAEAYLEYKTDNNIIIERQNKIADKQVALVTQKVEDKFERRLIEEFLKQRNYIDKKFEGIDKKFEGIDKKFEGIDKKFEGIDKRFEGINKKFEGINEKFNKQWTVMIIIMIFSGLSVFEKYMPFILKLI
jgi:hypothetical protein